MSAYKESASNWIQDNERSIIKISDEIWDYAELGLVEFKSSALLADELAKNGFKVYRGIAGMPTAFMAVWGEGKPAVGIMGEYDALPGLSQKRAPFKKALEQGRPGHGCGHNIHGTSGMAAAIAAREAMEKHDLGGSVKFFGCPAEENFSGKVYMVREGCFDGVDALISHHPSTMNKATLMSSLAVNSVKFHFHGEASHAGASPEQGRSALDGVELMNVGANYLREHVIQDARIHYIIEEGGRQPNIVPSYANSWYYIRAPERDEVQFIYDWVIEIAEGAAMMTRTKVETEFLEGTYNIIPNRTISELIVQNMREIGLPELNDQDAKFAEDIANTITPQMKMTQLKKSKRPGWEDLLDKLTDDEFPDPWGEGEVSHGSTDVADVSWQAPTVEFETATYVLGTPAHSWQAVAQSGVGIGHRSLIFAAKVMAATAIDLFTETDVLNRAKQEHRKTVGKREYKSPIPKDHNPPLEIWEKRSHSV